VKVAFLIQNTPGVGSSRHRVLQYVPFLRDQGIDVHVCPRGRRWKEKFEFYRTLGDYDVLYILRKLFHPAEFWYVRRKAKKVVYDFDDALMYRSSGARSYYSLSRRIRFAWMMPRVDYVVAGNEYLKSHALRYNPNVIVIPTSVDLSRYTLKKRRTDDGAVTLGWIGSASTLRYLKTVVPALQRVCRENANVEFKMVSDRFLEGLEFPAIRKPWSSEDEQADLQSFDIGLAPLSDDLWSRGKCSLKVLQYYGVGVPVVCSPFGVNREIVKDGVNGFWAENQREWEQKLTLLIRDEGLRCEMGMKGRATAEEGYSIAANAPRLCSVLKEVAGPAGDRTTFLEKP
jgi:glycosyltransferase involved in cell wall biosynthesis